MIFHVLKVFCLWWNEFYLSSSVNMMLFYFYCLLCFQLLNCWDVVVFFFKEMLIFGCSLPFFTCCRSPPHCCSPVKWSTEYSDQPSESAPIHCIERTLKHRSIPNGLRFLSSQYVLTLLQANVKFISSHCIFIIWSKE